MALQSSTSTLDNVLPAMDFILEMFEDGKERFKDNDFMAPCINSAQLKLNKYYAKTLESPAYISALVLHLAFKQEYIEATQDLVTTQEEQGTRSVGKDSKVYSTINRYN